MQGFANLLGVALERRSSEERLRLAHERNEEILESISDAFYAVDRDWRFTYVNRKAEEWWKRKREDLIGKVYWGEFPAAVGSEAYEAHQLARREHRTVHIETVSPLLGHWVDMDIHPTTAGGLSVYFRDVSERKRGEAALRATEERYRLAARATNDAIWDWDLGANRILWNEALTTLFGYTDTGTTGAWWKDHIHPEDRERVVRTSRRSLQVARSIGARSTASCGRTDPKPTSSTVASLSGTSRETPLRMIGAMLDLTERKRAEAALRASEEFTRSILEELDRLHQGARLGCPSPVHEPGRPGCHGGGRLRRHRGLRLARLLVRTGPRESPGGGADGSRRRQRPVPGPYADDEGTASVVGRGRHPDPRARRLGRTSSCRSRATSPRPSRRRSTSGF